MSAVKQMHQLTAEMKHKISDSTIDSDKLLEEINSFLEQRDSLIKGVKPPYTEEEQVLGNELVQLDKEIQATLQTLLLKLKGSMKQVQNQKGNTQKYMNPYKNLSNIDGMFFDKRN
ncbi:flagellar protein FliT [Salirhabdus euzebyi]|uniref:Flagellar protein FliT n=1 Tax=Salirhabdus euzebyi TaxID=394506 RepID=A0A841Q5I2_9BACI|nr:hypothetical protein [Salirhabdus euzebyi]MBB6453617.1 flagellar protein FliT [Salirhabdus euzebyi]